MYQFKKNERITGEKRIESLFSNGQSFVAYPMRVIFVKTASVPDLPPVSVLVSVPKKRIKSAVQRNKIKRLIRETYRLNKHLITKEIDFRLDVAFVYVKDELTDYATVEKGMLKALKLLSEQAQQIEKQQEKC